MPSYLVCITQRMRLKQYSLYFQYNKTLVTITPCLTRPPLLPRHAGIISYWPYKACGLIQEVIYSKMDFLPGDCGQIEQVASCLGGLTTQGALYMFIGCQLYETFYPSLDSTAWL